jgi:putative ABC transport system permease protein
MLSDIRRGVRLFARRPGLTLAAVCSLALGIGANTAIFSVLNAVVLRPLPFPQADRLVAVWETSADNPTRWVAPANYLDWRRESRSFAALAAYDSFSTNLTGRGEPERLRAAGAAGDFFTTLGVRPALGRALLPSDDDAGTQPVAVLTHGLWQRLFGGASTALGQSLLLDGRPHIVVGVLPEHFRMPGLNAVEIWVNGDRGIPRSFPFPGDITTVRDSHILLAVGRLADDASAESARAELSAIMTRLAEKHPDTNAGLGANVVPLHEQVVGNVRPLVFMLQLAVGAMLLIGCANVASLLLGQAAARQAELATRIALGASRWRLVRQLLLETLVLAVPSGAAALLLAVWGLDALVALAPAELPRAQEIAIDGAVLAFTASVTLGATIVFGLGPAVRASRAALSPAAYAMNRLTGGRGVRRWHRAMAVTELALAQLLLAGAGLLLASFAAAQRVDLGFAPEGRTAADLSLPADRYLRPAAGATGDDFRIDTGPKRALVEQVLERLRSTPGVRAAAASFTAPLAGAPNRGIRIEGEPDPGPGLSRTSDFQVVTPDYFRTLGMTVIRGRGFTAADRGDSPAVIVVNQTFVDRYLAGRDAIGRAVLFGGSARHEIVGIVNDARYRDVEQPADPTFYVPLAQNNERWPFLSFTVLSEGEHAPMAPALREAVRAADPNLPIARIRSYDEILRTALAPRRFNTWLVGMFAGVALLLAAVGTYGVLAYAVAARTREIGVRAALGASPRELVRLVMREGVFVTLCASAVGIAGGLAAAGLLRGMLFEVGPRDPSVFGAVAALLTTVGLVATWLPARRATMVDPTTALRAE